MKYFPIFLAVENRTAVVFGGGAGAAAKLRLLQKTQAQLFVVAETLDQDVLDLGQATWVKAHPLSYNLPADTALVYAATEDAALDEALAARAQAKGVLACAVDQPAPSDFITPAFVDRDPIVVAVGTEGTAPVLARDIKSTIENLLEPSLGAVARVAARLRPLVAKVTAADGQRRAFWHDFFRKARVQPARATEIGHNLLAALKPARPKLSFITVPSGQASLDQGGREALHRADLVIFDPDVDPGVLELARREAVRIKQAAASSAHVAQAFAKAQHVTLVRRQPGPDQLSELAAGFGVLAQVFPQLRPLPPQSIMPLAQAA